MGTEPTNSIEINGKIYDARTGQLVNKHAQTTGVTHAQTKTTLSRSRQSIDSVVPAHHIAALTKTKKAHAQAPHASGHKTQRPHTLMRRSVMKPQKPKPATAIKALSPIARPAHKAAIAPKLSATQIPSQRAAIAANTPKSPAISKYSKPVFAPRTTIKQAAMPSAATQMPAKAPPQSAHAAYFQKALQQAGGNQPQATTQRAKKPGFFKRHHSIAAAAASITVFVAAGAFIAFANMSKIELKIANTRAGISATIPGYEPTGYTKDGPVAYSAGKVTVSFKNTYLPGQTYEISQQKSDLNSSTLQDEVLSESKPRQTIQQNGNTIYLYGDSDAAWVSGGILYTISGSANLSDNEILLIADSV
ncbi:MAG: DUF4367 domain-containing protein [Candidatus Saccharimonadales bacterium]